MLWSGCREAEAKVLALVSVCVAIVDGVGNNISGAVLVQLSIFLGASYGTVLGIA